MKIQHQQNEKHRQMKIHEQQQQQQQNEDQQSTSQKILRRFSQASTIAGGFWLDYV